MSINKVFARIWFAIILLGGFPTITSAQTCEEIGASCRPGWISGCGSTESYVGNSCPANPSGELICCQQPQGTNDCTNAGGICRSDYYAINFPSEPACGYANGDVQSGDSCGGPAQICCIPPPNVGAPCATSNGSGVCELSASGCAIFEPSGDCHGGAQCCIPPALPSLAFFTVPSCVIPVGGSTCDISVSWSILNPVTPQVAQNTTVFSIDASSSGVTRTLNFGVNGFEISDTSFYTYTPANATCQGPSLWDGSVCALSPPPSPVTLNVPPSCDIPIGSSTCDLTVSWDIPSPVNPQVSANGTLFSTDATSPGFSIVADHGLVLVQAWNDGSVVKSASSNARCISGSTWNGSICEAVSGICIGTPSGKSGLCRGTCDATEDDNSADACGSNKCCVPKEITPPPSDACTGSPSGKPGLCQATCEATTQDEEFDYACGSTLFCCVPKGSTLPPSSACTGSPSGKSGLCRATCDATEDTDSAVACGSDKCCVPKGSSGGGSSSGTPVGYVNPLKWDGVVPFLAQIMIELQKLIATLAIIMIVIGGLIYITSAGDSGRTEWAKRAILAALIGLGLGIAAPMFFKEIADLLGWVPVGLPAATNTLLGTAMGVVNFLLSVIGILAIIMLVVGAFMYLTAAGDESRIDTGKEIVKYSVIGIAVALSALVLIRLVVNFF